jgi:plastocyanin
MRARRRAVSLILVAGGLAACVSDRPTTAPEPPAGSGNGVAIKNFAYVPPSLSVSSGTTVTWTNQDDVAHTVSAEDDKTFDAAVEPGRTFQFTAGTPGTYAYFCRFHPFMKGTLTVTAP